MGEMKFLEKLLDGVGVEWKALKDIGIYVRGLVYNKSSESSDGQGYKVLRANNITLSENSLNFDDVKIVNFDTKVKKDQKLRCNDILISAASGSREHVGKVAFIEADIDYYFGGFMGVIRCSTSMIPRYAFHILTSQHFKIYLDEMLNSSTINNLNSAVMGDFKFPIPCPDNPQKSLEIQAEIVRILDAMTAHTAELTAELTARKKQYDYYRDKLLSFDEGEVEWRKLGEVATVTKLAGFEFTNHVRYADSGKIIALRGLNVKGNLDLSDVKYIDGSNFSKLSRSKLYIDDMLFTYVGTVGSVALIDEDDKYYLAPNVALIRLETKNIIPRYMFYYFQTSEFRKTQIDRYSGNSSMQNLTMENIRKFKIAIPSLSEQARIVEMLDKFDALTTSLTEGLPREIELREKQYAYYRDLLLSFPAAQAA